MSPRRVEGTPICLGDISVNIKGLTGPKIDYRGGHVYSWSQYKMRVSTPSSQRFNDESRDYNWLATSIRINDD